MYAPLALGESPRLPVPLAPGIRNVLYKQERTNCRTPARILVLILPVVHGSTAAVVCAWYRTRMDLQ